MSAKASFMKLKIGELATRCGLSIRTLHHYDAIGLLQPTGRTAGGARLYGWQDFRRLHRIQVLKQMGYSLTDIHDVLDNASVDPLTILDRQAQLLDAQARRAEALSATLKDVARRLVAGADADAADWLSLLELTALYEQHLSDDEVLALRSPAASTTQAIGAVRRQLVLEVGQCMRENVSPGGCQARELAWRWVDMVITLTSNNAPLAEKLRRLQMENRRAQDIVGIDAAVLQWIDQAIVHARVHLFGEYLTPEQTARLLRLQLAHGNGWPALVAKVRAQMDAGVPHDAEPMRALAARWRQLFLDSYCGGDADLGERVRYALNHEPRLSLGVGVDDALLRYVHAAVAVATTPTAE